MITKRLSSCIQNLLSRSTGHLSDQNKKCSSQCLKRWIQRLSNLLVTNTGNVDESYARNWKEITPKLDNVDDGNVILSTTRSSDVLLQQGSYLACSVGERKSHHRQVSAAISLETVCSPQTKWVMFSC